MIGFAFDKFTDETEKVAKAVQKATRLALRKAAYAIFRTAQESIQTAGGPSPAGEPPHSRRGQLRRAERYDVDDAAEIAVIGPRFSMVGTSAEAHEFGGEYKKEQYPKRPFMGPALEKNRALIPAFWQGEVTE
jgi:hypothetical protein